MSEQATADTSTPKSRLLTVAEARQRLGIGKTRMYELINSGAITSVKLPGPGGLNVGAGSHRGGGRRIEESEVEDFIRRHRTPAAAAP